MKNKRSLNRIRIISVLLFLLAFMFIQSAPVMGQMTKETATVEISPSTGAPGTALTITGKGFIPGEELDIVLILEEGMRVGLGTEKVEMIEADSSGAFNAASAVPLMAKPGQYKVEVEGSKGTQATSSLEVLPKK